MKSNIPLANIFYTIMVQVVVLVSLTLPMGCGGSSEDTVASGGIGGTGATAGVVTDYGSIFVNGIEFDTSETDIFVEGTWVGSGDAATRDHLPIGQMVVVESDAMTERSGAALQVNAFYRVRGPAGSPEEIDGQTRRFIILGQSIVADPSTIWSGVTFDGLTPESMVQVSGIVDDQGVIRASHIALAPSNSPMALKGPLRDLNSHEQTFFINSQRVDFSRLSPPPDIATLAGQPVQVQGWLDGDTLVADTLDRFDTESFDSCDVFSIDGFLSAPIGPDRWQVGAYEVRFDGASRFDGLAPDDISQGLRLQLRGRLQQRVLTIENARPALRVWLESTIDAIHTSEGRIALIGMPALTIQTNPLTRIRGAANTLADLQVGDHVRIYARVADDALVTAEFLFKTPAAPLQDRFRLQGPASQIIDPQVWILGVALDTTANAGIAFYDANEQPISRERFIADLTMGDVVRAGGQWVSDTIVFEEMAIVR